MRSTTYPGKFNRDQKRTGVKENALGPLLAWALEVVPSGRHKDTPIFLFGTAGLRNLPKEQQDNVLEAVKTTLHDTPFRWISFFPKVEDRSSLSQLRLLFLPLELTVPCPSGILTPCCVLLCQHSVYRPRYQKHRLNSHVLLHFSFGCRRLGQAQMLICM